MLDLRSTHSKHRIAILENSMRNARPLGCFDCLACCLGSITIHSWAIQLVESRVRNARAWPSSERFSVITLVFNILAHRPLPNKSGRRLQRPLHQNTKRLTVGQARLRSPRSYLLRRGRLRTNSIQFNSPRPAAPADSQPLAAGR